MSPLPLNLFTECLHTLKGHICIDVKISYFQCHSYSFDGLLFIELRITGLGSSLIVKKKKKIAEL